MMSSVIISQTQDICDGFLEMKCSVDAVALKRSQIACDSRGEGLCLTGMAV